METRFFSSACRRGEAALPAAADVQLITVNAIQAFSLTLNLTPPNTPPHNQSTWTSLTPCTPRTRRRPHGSPPWVVRKITMWKISRSTLRPSAPMRTLTHRNRLFFSPCFWDSRGSCPFDLKHPMGYSLLFVSASPGRRLVRPSFSLSFTPR